MTDWARWFRDPDPDPASALAAARLLVGAAHRLAWIGPDPEGDRRFAIEGLRRATSALELEEAALAAVLDWWLVAAARQPSGGEAWAIDRMLPAPTGDALRSVLDLPEGLREVRRPARFREVLAALRTASDRNPGKIAGDKPILQAANDECKRLLRAARDGAAPPTGLRLEGLDDAGLDAWASEGSGSRRVIPGTPIWETLVKQLRLRATLVAQALEAWPHAGRTPAPTLPAGWEAQVAGAVGEAGAELALALVHDGSVEPPPRPLLDVGAARAALATLPTGFPAAIRLGREAHADQPGARPRWLVAAMDRIDALAERLDQPVAWSGDAAGMIAEAKVALRECRLDEAERWLAEAEADHRGAAEGVEHARRVERARGLAVDLVRLDRPVALPTTDPAWPERVQAAWAEARAALSAQLGAMLDAEFVTAGGEPSSALVEKLTAAAAALDRSQLGDAVGPLREAEVLYRALREQEAAALGPSLGALRDRIAGSPPADQAGLYQLLARAAARRTAGLSHALEEADLAHLLEVLAKKGVPAAVTVEPHGRLQRVAWVFGGVPTSGDEARSYSAKVLGIKVHGSPPGDAPSRVRGWGELVSRPTDAVGDGPLFRWVGGRITGPWVRVDGVVLPADATGLVASLDETRFAALFGALEVAPGRALVVRPPTLAELGLVGATLEDGLEGERLAAWLATALDGAPEPRALRSWLAAHPTSGLPKEVAAARLAKLEGVVAASEAVAHHREAAVAAWLRGPEGVAAREEATSRAVAHDSERLREAHEAARAALEEELAAARAQTALDLDRLRASLREVEAARDAARGDLEVAQELLADRKLALLARFGLGGAPPTGPVPPLAAPAQAPLQASPYTPTSAPPLPELVRAVAGATWAEVDVANFVLSLATGRWTLLAGLPGVGKSTFVRSVLSRLGHGPGTERWLELVVRRDWQDDAALFGFWHPTERAWVPSSEGFVEQLLRARHDAERGDPAIWPVLVEELNLASPEYYLARPISAFEASPPELRLYDRALTPSNGDRYPASFQVPDPVRIVATVNVDDTVERLSPRFLSRASVIWMEPSPDGPPWRPEDDVPRAVLRWRDLAIAGASGEAGLGRIAEVVRYLQDQRIPGAPSVRTQRAIARYLGASRGVLPAPDAEDLQILQRILPPVRGTGPRWRSILDGLWRLLERSGWRRAASRTRELRERGEELGDWYDFFHA